MNSNTNKLLLVGGDAISNGTVADLEGPSHSGLLLKELCSLLQQKNGFYAFCSALHIFTSTTSSNELGLTDWNSDSLWRRHYNGLTQDYFFFAEDIFGGQFCFVEGSIRSFDPETGATDFVSETLEEWAGRILESYEVLTGYHLAKQWQEANGRLTPGKRLVPKIPFVAGGQFNVENLHEIDSVKGMRWRGEIATQISDLPDGGQIKFKVVD